MFATDEATAKLVLQLQMEDMELLNQSSKGKGREDEVSDAQVAMELYRQDLEGNSAVISDRIMSKSIAHAIETDGQLLSGEFEREDARARGLFAADSGKVTQVPKEVIGEAQIMSDEVLEQLAAKDLNGTIKSSILASESRTREQSEFIDEPESSAWAATRKRLTPNENDQQAIPNRACVSCGDEFQSFHLASVPCGHEYCKTCLHELFRLAMGDESLFPPRCCRQHITLGAVRMWLDKDLVEAFDMKKIEFDTPNRTYCSKKECSQFIRTDKIANDIATCSSCATRTCTMCKGAAHGGDCPNDTALQQVLEMAEANQWKRCNSCSAVVELVTGCNHIT